MKAFLLAVIVISNCLLFSTCFPAQALTAVHPELASSAKTAHLPREIIVLGDVDRTFTEVTELLMELALIDANFNWIAINKHLISLGNLASGGKDSRRLIELFMKLHKQAFDVGGEVSLIFGDNEIKLMTSDFSQVSKQEFSWYIDLEIPQARQWLFEQFQTANEGSNYSDFNRLYPPGFMGLIQAFSINGHIGQWLRSNGKAVIKIADSLFVHGGISKQTLAMSISEINQTTAALITEYDQLSGQLSPYHFLPVNSQAPSEQLVKLQRSKLFSATGPFRYRGNVYCPEISESYAIEKIKNKFSVAQLFVGHSVNHHRITARINHAVIMAGFESSNGQYQDLPAAVIITKDNIKAHYLGKAAEQDIGVYFNSFKNNPAAMTDADVETFLQHADIIDNRPIGAGITKSRVLTLQQGDRQLRALFKTFDAKPNFENKQTSSFSDVNYDRYGYEIAAYKLDRLLGQYLVPPTTMRVVESKQGAIQLWVEDVITENNRLDNNIAYRGECSMLGALRTRGLFDVLIYNVDRNNGNYLWDKDFAMVLIDHSQAFGTKVGLPAMYRKSKMHISNFYKAKLQALTSELLTAQLGSLLNTNQIQSILKRRDYIIARDEKYFTK